MHLCLDWLGPFTADPTLILSLFLLILEREINERETSTDHLLHISYWDQVWNPGMCLGIKPLFMAHKIMLNQLVHTGHGWNFNEWGQLNIQFFPCLKEAWVTLIMIILYVISEQNQNWEVEENFIYDPCRVK